VREKIEMEELKMSKSIVNFKELMEKEDIYEAAKSIYKLKVE
jgi:hypothetical protein